jgi:hypothetical protein
MAFDTFANLQTEIVRFARRESSADFVAKVPSFIELAEAEISRKLRTYEMESLESLAAIGGAASVTLPAGCISIRYLKLEGANERDLTVITHAGALALHHQEAAGIPKHYIHERDIVRLYPTPAEDMTLTALCTLIPTPLSESNASNDILASYPDLYYYGALYHAFNYLRNDEQAGRAKAMFEEALFTANKQNISRRSSGTPFGTISISRRRIP